MRHRNRGRKLGHNSAHRKALSRNIVRSLFLNGQIVTTISKAKEYAPTAEKMISIAKKVDTKIAAMKARMTEGKEMTAELKAEIDRQAEAIRVAQIRFALSKLPDKEVVQRLFYVIAPLFTKRNGGYTRIIHLNKTRLGDNAKQAILALVEKLPDEATIQKQREEKLKALKKAGEEKRAKKAKMAKK
jgi:large subunit ribosomal protein L17